MDFTSTMNNDTTTTTASPSITSDDVEAILSLLSPDQLQSVVASALPSSPQLLAAVRATADKDPSQRDLFIRGLSDETTSDDLRSLFSSFGEIEEASIVSRSKGFVTFKYVDGAIRALKEASTKIGGGVTVMQLTSVEGAAPDVSSRRICVENVPVAMSLEKLFSLFASFGEIEVGLFAICTNTVSLLSNYRRNVLFVYKTAEAARAAVAMPNKTVDGHAITCKLANKTVDGQSSSSSSFGGYGGSGFGGAYGSSSQQFGRGGPGWGVGYGGLGMGPTLYSRMLPPPGSGGGSGVYPGLPPYY